MKIREMLRKDWPMVSAIYKEGLDTRIATFETEVPSWEKWDASHISSCRFVADNEDSILGWTALSQVSKREVYKGVAEVSIYIEANSRGSKVGQGCWTLQAGIFPENEPSILLHQKMGFRMIGFREKVASRNGKWHDNCLLERRSKTVGIN